MNRLEAIKLLLTLTCDRSTELVSQSLHEELSRTERWAVRLHAISCRSCRRFRRQLSLLREAVRRFGTEMPAGRIAVGQSSLSPASRRRIQSAIRRALHDAGS